MSEEVATIPTQDELIAILSQEDKPETAPEATTTATSEAAEIKTEQASPAPAPEQGAPQPKTLADTDLVIDPADGVAKKWGEIKSERLRQADYTRKTMAVAEERRAIEAMRAQIQAEQALAEQRAKRATMPGLPEDDPYAQHIAAQQAQLDAIAQYQATMQEQMQAQLADRELAASQVALQAEEQRLVAAHGLSERELELVEREYFHRASNGETVTLDSVAGEHKAYVAALKQAAIEEWKSKHRVAPDATVPASAPAVGEKVAPIDMRSESFVERIRAAMAGA